MNNFSEYLKLGEKNDQLADENSQLLEELINIKSARNLPQNQVDSIKKYKLISAEVINNSINQKNNKITLNKGKEEGILAGLGVINSEGLIGITRDVSAHYATAISLLNLQTSISVRLKRTLEIGELIWDGRSVKKMIMNSVPPHSQVVEGDSVVTSGFSTVFPEGIYVGSVVAIAEDRRSGFLSLDVELNNDLSNLDFVYIVKNLKAEEQLKLELDE
jgi:rod shape-determining protein MreC